MDNLIGIRRSLVQLSLAPESQIAQSIRERLARLAIDPSVKQMKAILDDCARYSLASDFAMVAMDIVWNQLKDHDSSQKHSA